MTKITPSESAELKRKVNDHIKSADWFLKSADLDAALEETQKALRLDPGNIYAQAFKKKISAMIGDKPVSASAPTPGPQAAPPPAPPVAAAPPPPVAPPAPAPVAKAPEPVAPAPVAPPVQPVAPPAAIAQPVAPPPAAPSSAAQATAPQAEARPRKELQRKLAAIMFTDMVNYSVLTQKNEFLAVQLLEEHRKILRPLFWQYDGVEIKTIGDAFLVEFVSVLQAVRCAIAIQHALSVYNEKVTGDHRIAIRVGIHLGDVIYQDDDIIGDGVNIASRIQSSAESGGICISQDVYNQIRAREDIHAEDIGEVSLKGILSPVHLYKVFTSEEAFRREEDQAIKTAISEGKRLAKAEVVEQTLQKARDAFKKGELEDALGFALSISKIDPSNPEIKKIDSNVREQRKKQFTAKLEEERKIPREMFHEIYSRLLQRAWNDGALSSVELSLLDNVRGSFQINDNDHKMLERKAQLDVYEASLKEFIEAGEPEGEMQIQLGRLRTDLKISEEDHIAVEAKLKPLNTF